MKKDVSKSTYPDLINRITDILIAARTKVVREINKAQRKKGTGYFLLKDIVRFSG